MEYAKIRITGIAAFQEAVDYILLILLDMSGSSSESKADPEVFYINLI